MIEREQEKEQLSLQQVGQKLYYDWESRFIKQRVERLRMASLPRVIKPDGFARGGHALGDVRVFDRYAVGPISALTCSFLTVGPNERTDLRRSLPGFILYVLDGAGICHQEGEPFSFTKDDVVVVPPYTRCAFEGGGGGFRAWIPQTRLWHVVGLLWEEWFEFNRIPEGTEAIPGSQGETLGFRIPEGVLGLEEPLEIRGEPDSKRAEAFLVRRSAPPALPERTKYDWFLQRNAEENQEEASWPRVIRGALQPWEHTRQGRIRFHINLWTPVAARDLDLMTYEIEPSGSTGQHRHIFEELLLVLEGRGHDVHDGTSYAWEEGDLICVPMMAAHQHFNDAERPARLVSVWPRARAYEYMGGISQLSPASSWESGVKASLWRR